MKILWAIFLFIPTLVFAQSTGTVTYEVKISSEELLYQEIQNLAGEERLKQLVLAIKDEKYVSIKQRLINDLAVLGIQTEQNEKYKRAGKNFAPVIHKSHIERRKQKLARDIQTKKGIFDERGFTLIGSAGLSAVLMALILLIMGLLKKLKGKK